MLSWYSSRACPPYRLLRMSNVCYQLSFNAVGKFGHLIVLSYHHSIKQFLLHWALSLVLARGRDIQIHPWRDCNIARSFCHLPLLLFAKEVQYWLWVISSIQKIQSFHLQNVVMFCLNIKAKVIVTLCISIETLINLKGS